MKAVTDSKFEGFDRVYRGTSPHYEVWYGKVDLPDQQALWFRYKTLDGAVEAASAWAVFFGKNGIRAGKKRWWLDEVQPAGPVTLHNRPENALGKPMRFEGRHAVFRVGDAHLDDANALGTAGPISWDLHWKDSGKSFRYIPPSLQKFGLARSTYDDCFMDLRVSGRVTCDNQIVDFENATGMVGHIQGSKIAGHSWAWSHCNHFDDNEDAVFEGLSARALLGKKRASPLMTALILFLEGHRYEFHGPIQIFQTKSDFGRHKWSFAADTGDVRLSGEARAPSEVALVRYTDTDGSGVWCYNSKLGSLKLRLNDRKRGIDKILHSSNRAAYETVTRDKPREPALI